MQLSDEHHDYECTRCGRTGAPCMQALWLAQRVALGLAGNAGRLPEAYEVISETVFTGCGQNCRARLTVTEAGIGVDCARPDATVPGLRHRITARARDAAERMRA